jgi:phosphonate transport system permease protein
MRPDRIIAGIPCGAKLLRRYRFGVIPQLMPILLSQVLYFLESNTRSTTITGGGIVLLMVQAVIIQKDWEEMTYYIVLVVVMVIVMGWMSGVLRRKLINGDEAGH